MRNPQNHFTVKQSFTLIELVVVTGIFGILVVAIGQFLSSFLNMKFNAETIQRIRQEGNYALDQIDYLVRNSLTLPDVCVGRIEPKNQPSSGFNIYLDVDKNGEQEGVVNNASDLSNASNRHLLCEIDVPPPYTNLVTQKSDAESMKEFCSGVSGIGGPKNRTFNELRTNTQGDTPEMYFVRNLVTLATHDGVNYNTNSPLDPINTDPITIHNGGSLYLFRTREADRKHDQRQLFAEDTSNVDAVALTNFRTGVGGDAPFHFNNLQFYCYFDYFTNGYIVNTSFDISYRRRSLGRDDLLPEVSESFSRSTVVRNPYPFEY